MFSDVTAENIHVTPAAKLNDSPAAEILNMNASQNKWTTALQPSFNR